jgi:CMP-N-acetylneuraminic acid synthetase
MKILGVIPARGGSKGVLHKNIRFLGGKPLIVHTIEAARNSRLSHCIVSTDSEEIAAVAKNHGAEVPFLRPAELATDTAKSIPVMVHALRWLEQKTGTEFDALMMLQPTTPFRTSADIDAAIRKMEETDCDSVISVVDVEGHHPARMKYLEGDRLIDPPFCEVYENQPRQELIPMYIRNGAIYLTKRNVLIGGSFKGSDCRALICQAERSVNIDTELDFDYAEWVLQNHLS